MAKEKIEVGDIRPIYEQVGWEVCKSVGEKPEEEEWVQTEKQAEAELLSDAFKRQKKK